MRAKLYPFYALLTVLGITTAADALVRTATRRFPGSACVKVGTTGVLGITSNDGAVYNDSSSSVLTVDCPVLGNWAGSNDSPLWYLDQSTSSISCTLSSEAASSSSAVSQTLSSTGDDNGYRVMTFEVDTLEEAFTHIRCTIPVRDASGNASFIIGYSGD